VASSLNSAQVESVLARLHAKARTEDPVAKERVAARESELGVRLSAPERYELYDQAPLAITEETGELYYVLVVARRPRLIVEFGASHGISTIYLAAALRDSGGGALITTEILATKAAAAEANLAEAGLADFVDVRLGDARETLAGLADPVDMLVLDGRNDLYVSILETVRPRLTQGAIIVADLGLQDPDLQAYQQHVRQAAPELASTTLPVDAGIELTVAVEGLARS
jgi:predicted O-methyltransferase YrrM